MAPASASPQPPSGRSDTGGRGEPGSDAARDEALAEEPTHRGEPVPRKLARGQDETYGPLSVERQVKQDGRALILYARRQRRDG